MMQAQSVSQRSRGKFLKKPPEHLKYLIEIVNCLPPDGLDLRLMNPEALKAEVEAELDLDSKTKSEITLDVSLDAAACESTRKLLSELRDYVWRGEWKGTSFHVDPVSVDIDIWAAITDGKVTRPGAFRRFAEVWDAHETLHGIANAAKEPHLRWRLFRLGRHASIWHSVQIDVQGMLYERKSLLSKAIAGHEGIEAARIRECPICTRIFWAGRIDAGQCGTPKCKSALSSRLNRNPERRELYNKARRKKRRNQKKARENAIIDEGRELRRPTAKSE